MTDFFDGFKNVANADRILEIVEYLRAHHGIWGAMSESGLILAGTGSCFATSFTWSGFLDAAGDIA
jgi:hypothetical protein